MQSAPEPGAASADLEFVRRIVARTDQRIDPHGFHFVHWGLIVLVWYPLSNYFALRGWTTGVLMLGIGAFALGMVLSGVREALLAKRNRLPGENTFIGRQVAWVTLTSVGAGVVLSAVAPASGFLTGPDVPTLWGLVYANLAAMVGIVYRREFLVSGLAIFVAAVATMIFVRYNGFILGPFMGLGLVLPGLRAERRVRALQEEEEVRGD